MPVCITSLMDSVHHWVPVTQAGCRSTSAERISQEKERHRRNAVSQNHPGWAADGCQGRNGAVGSRKGPGRQLGGLEITPVRIMGLSVTAGTGNEVGKDRQRYAQK